MDVPSSITDILMCQQKKGNMSILKLTLMPLRRYYEKQGSKQFTFLLLSLKAEYRQK